MLPFLIWWGVISSRWIYFAAIASLTDLLGDYAGVQLASVACNYCQCLKMIEKSAEKCSFFISVFLVLYDSVALISYISIMNAIGEKRLKNRRKHRNHFELRTEKNEQANNELLNASVHV